MSDFQVFFVSKYVLSEHDKYDLTCYENIKLSSECTISEAICAIRNHFGIAESEDYMISPNISEMSITNYKKVNNSIKLKNFAIASKQLHFLPLKKISQIQNIYKPISSYSFYDDDDYVKIILNISGVQKQQVTCLLEERKLEAKIDNLREENYIFRITKTHDKYVSNEISFVVKADKIILKLKKKNPKVSVFSLYKQKMIGEVPSDDENSKN